MTGPELEARVLALVATAADGRHGDVDALVTDLHGEDLGTVVWLLASLGVTALMPPGVGVRPVDARTRIADGLRGELLRRAAPGPHDDDATA